MLNVMANSDKSNENLINVFNVFVYNYTSLLSFLIGFNLFWDPTSSININIKEFNQKVRKYKNL